jgi:hypothetical protein
MSLLVQNYLTCELAGTKLPGTWARWYKIIWHVSSLVQNYLAHEFAGTKIIWHVSLLADTKLSGT